MNESIAHISPSHLISSIEQLDSLYGEPNPQSLIKEIDHISDHYRQFIEASPFVVVATSGPEGLDCSPKGDPPGFVRVQNEKTILMPDRRGNNRLDSLRNLVRDARISLLFLIPGVAETMRINGLAQIVTDPELCQSFALRAKVPKCVLVISVERIYFQCPKALIRSRIWHADAQIPRSDLPSTGEMLEGLSSDSFDGAEYDRNYPERLKQTIY